MNNVSYTLNNRHNAYSSPLLHNLVSVVMTSLSHAAYMERRRRQMSQSDKKFHQVVTILEYIWYVDAQPLAFELQRARIPPLSGIPLSSEKIFMLIWYHVHKCLLFRSVHPQSFRGWSDCNSARTWGLVCRSWLQ